MIELPSGWATSTLGELCPGRVEQGEPDEQPVPYIDIGSIDRATKAITPSQKVTANDAPTRARLRVAEGDVLVSMTRPNLNAVAIVPKELNGAIASTGFDVLRTQRVLPEWVFNRVRSHEFIAAVCEGLQGVVYPAIRPHDVRRHVLPVPPLAEQQRIVEAIESYLTRIDRSVATLERVQRNLKRYRASVVKTAVEGRLAPTEAQLARAEGRDYEPASKLLERILAERRQRWGQSGGKGKYEEPAQADTSSLPSLPDDWCWATVGQMSEVGTGATPNRSRLEYWEGGRVPWVTSAVVGRALVTEPSELVTERALKETNLTLYPAGTLLVAMYGEGRTRGACTELGIAATTNQALAALVTVGQANAIRPWLRLFLEAHYETLRGRASGGVQPNLNLRIVRAIAVPLPPLVEQSRVLANCESLLSRASAEEIQCASHLRRLARLRQSILKWAFEGKLVDQDPNDEPAAVLLERIKAERAAAAPAAKSRAKPPRAKVTR